MNSIYRQINLTLEYLEQHLEEELDFAALAKISGLNVDTLQRFFPLLAGVSLSEYLRKRRLTLAGRDLMQSGYRIIDLAEKYCYASTTTFSRAFQKFHGVTPSFARQNHCRLNFFPKLELTPPDDGQRGLFYEIVENKNLELHGLSVKTNNKMIKQEAPGLFRKVAKEYPNLPHPDYGAVIYNAGRESLEDYEYWVLWRQPHPDLQKFSVQSSHFLKFTILSQEAAAVQKTSDYFYEQFLPTCPYRLSLTLELEHYHDQQTDFLVPIAVL